MSIFRPLRWSVGAAATLALLAGCAGSAEHQADPLTDRATASTAEPAGAAMAVTTTTAPASEATVSFLATGATLPPTTSTTEAIIEPSNVLAAAVVIAGGGDIEAALFSGEFTLAEVEAAVEAIETGTLERYAS